MIGNLNSFLKSFWIARSNIGFRKVLLIVATVFFIGIIGTVITQYFLFIYTSLVILILIGGWFLYLITKNGYNRKVIDDSNSDFTVYDHREIFSSKNNTRIIRFASSIFSSRVWLSLDKNRKRSAYLADLIDLIPDKIFNKNTSFLHLGGCANSIPLYLVVKYPKISHDIVEVNQDLIEVSKKYFYPLFGKDDYKNISIYNDDAKNFINKNKKKYSVIIQDIFLNDGSIPDHFLFNDWVENLISNHLKSKGWLFINISILTNEDMFKVIMSLSENVRLKNKMQLKSFKGYNCLYFHNNK